MDEGPANVDPLPLERAVQRDSGNPELVKSLGNARKAAGDLEGAAASYRRALELAPDHLACHYNLGLVLRQLNRLEEAERHFRRVHEADPDDADALFHLGSVLAEQSRFAEAARMYQDAVRRRPDNPYLWMRLGGACQELPGRLEDAARCLRRSIELEPQYAEAHYRLGLACKKLGRIEEAVAAYLRTLELEPAASEAHNDLGNIRQDEGRPSEAIAHYREAIRLSPDYAAAHNNLGGALVRTNQLGEALAVLRRAIELQPDLVNAHLNLGSAHSLLGARDRALQCYRSALRLAPGDAGVGASLLFELQQVCDWSDYEQLCEAQRRSVFESPESRIAPFGMLSIPSTPAEQLQCARNHAAWQVRGMSRDAARLRSRFERKAKPRLRVGYLSDDFREHAVAYLIAEMIELHDRDRFTIVAYSHGHDDGGSMRARLARAFDRFVDIAALSHADAAARIRADDVDILVDLKGYTQHARTEIVALRPAPIQVSYLGYSGTMGAEFIDYLIGDRYVTPPESAEHFAEKLVWLPDSFQVNDRTRAVAQTPPRNELGLPERSFVYCCFNQTYKIAPRVFAVWMRLLEGVRESVLWLPETNPWAVQNLRREAQRHGIDPERLVFAPKLPHLERHLGRLRAADLFLDTMPYNAHSTASDALWVGLPVLTCEGNTFASRVAGSLLSAVGLQELIARSTEEYEALALRLARMPQELAAVREKLSGIRSSAPLFDTPRFVRNLEAAYVRMWDTYLAGNEPRAIELQADQTRLRSA